MKNIMFVVATLVIAVLFTIYTAYVLSVLWGWFILPVFGISSPSIALIMGILLLIGIVRYDITKHTNTDKQDGNPLAKLLSNTIAVGFLVPSVSLLMGKIYTLFL